MRLTHVMVVAAGVLLAGCGSLFGSKGLPDESRVIAGPKLAVPPQFDLRPPREGDDFANRVSAEKSGEIQTLIGGAPVEKVETAPTDTDSWLLQTVGGGATRTVASSTTPVSGTVAVPVPTVDSSSAE